MNFYANDFTCLEEGVTMIPSSMIVYLPFRKSALSPTCLHTDTVILYCSCMEGRNSFMHQHGATLATKKCGTSYTRLNVIALFQPIGEKFKPSFRSITLPWKTTCNDIRMTSTNELYPSELLLGYQRNASEMSKEHRHQCLGRSLLA